MIRPDPLREVPPTAGLPLRWADLAGGGDLAAAAARFLGAGALQLECSGSAALVVALATLARLSPRRDVVVPGYTCPLVPIAIAQCGLRPVLCDLAPGGLDMDSTDLARLCGPDTLAVLPTHLGGRLADVAVALRIAHAAGAFVIEDAAQALGAAGPGGPAGLRGDIGFFSLAAGKGLTIFEGGLLHARDARLRAELARTTRQLVPFNPPLERRRCLELLGYAALYRPAGLPLAYGRPLRRALRRGDPVGAVGDRFPARIPLHRVGAWRQGVGVRALPRLRGFLESAQARAAGRVALLRRAGLPVIGDAPGGSWPFLWVLMPDIAARNRALEVLWPSGLGVTRLFIHALPDYPELAGLVAPAALPRARDLAARSLTISNSPWLRDGDFARVLDVLRTACS